MNLKNRMLLGVLGVGLLSCTGQEAQSQTRNQKTVDDRPANGVVVEKRWELPEVLTEISGIAFYKGQLACVQDEMGTIFLFNPVTGVVEREIAFGQSGDYEGIAIVGENAWVLRSDGQLFEVPDFASGKPGAVRSYATPLTRKQDTEGLFADTKNNRLLVSVKGKDPDGGDGKSVFAFNLGSRTLAPDAAYRLAAGSGVDGASAEKKQRRGRLQPSEIALHPGDRSLYVLDGPSRVLYVLDSTGGEVHRYQLDKKDFPQPEGIAFTPDGRLYLSTEGVKGRGAIYRVRLPANP